MKKVLIILTVMLLLAFTLTFFACNKEPVFAPNGICISENFIFFPEERNDLHNAELREAFEKYHEEKHIHHFDINSDYELYNYINKKNSKKYSLDVFEVKQGLFSGFFFKHKDTVIRMSCVDNSNENLLYLTNFAVTDINCDGYVEILTTVAKYKNTNTTTKDNYSLIYFYDTKTAHYMCKSNSDYASFFKENNDGVVSIYNVLYQPSSIDEVKTGVYDSSNLKGESIFMETRLNTSKFKFEKNSFKVSCDLFSVEGVVDEYTIMFPYYTTEDEYPSADDGRYFQISTVMTYLGDPFVHVESDSTLNGAQIKFVNETHSISMTNILAGWWLVTEFNIETGQKISDVSSYRDVSADKLPTGVYDMVVYFCSTEAGIYDEIIVEDFLTVTR